jgi:hypothetical protein
VGRENEQGVEPTTSLVKTLSNEIGGVNFGEFVLVFERVVLLGERHGTRLEPTVQDFGGTAQDTFTPARGDSQVVNVVTVEIGNACNTGQFLKLSNGADGNDLLILLPNT